MTLSSLFPRRPGQFPFGGYADCDVPCTPLVVLLAYASSGLRDFEFKISAENVNPETTGFPLVSEGSG